MIHHYAQAVYDSREARRQLETVEGEGATLFQDSPTERVNRLLRQTARAEGGTRHMKHKCGGVHSLSYDFRGDPDGAEATVEEWREVAASVGLRGPHFRAFVVAGEPYHETLTD
jgi:hypothetical protein